MTWTYIHTHTHTPLLTFTIGLTHLKAFLHWVKLHHIQMMTSIHAWKEKTMTVFPETSELMSGPSEQSEKILKKGRYVDEL